MTEAKDRRKHPRFHAGECGYLEICAGGRTICKHEVYVADISCGGLGLALECPLAVGTAVKITLSSCRVEGVVAHCREEGDGFVAGIKAHHLIDRVEQIRARGMAKGELEAGEEPAVLA